MLGFIHFEYTPVQKYGHRVSSSIRKSLLFSYITHVHVVNTPYHYVLS